MGYRDSFYTKDNILGYTGNLNDNPTVYFADAGRMNPKTVKVGGKDQVVVTFGHITQAHDIADNVGREKVFESFSYSISNVMEKDGKEHAQECVYGLQDLKHHDFHTSRNRFEAATGGNMEILALAISKHQNLKKRYPLSTE